MREIKFRGKVSGGGSWVYGSYWYDVDGDAHLIHNTDGIDFGVDPETVGQYTGALDKDGTEIYEGDIFKFHDTEWHEEGEDSGICKVIWMEELCAFGFEPIKAEEMTTLLPVSEYIEIRGNIYENPELLNAS